MPIRRENLKHVLEQVASGEEPLEIRLAAVGDILHRALPDSFLIDEIKVLRDRLRKSRAKAAPEGVEEKLAAIVSLAPKQEQLESQDELSTDSLRVLVTETFLKSHAFRWAKRGATGVVLLSATLFAIIFFGASNEYVQAEALLKEAREQVDGIADRMEDEAESAELKFADQRRRLEDQIDSADARSREAERQLTSAETSLNNLAEESLKNFEQRLADATDQEREQALEMIEEGAQEARQKIDGAADDALTGIDKSRQEVVGRLEDAGSTGEEELHLLAATERESLVATSQAERDQTLKALDRELEGVQLQRQQVEEQFQQLLGSADDRVTDIEMAIDEWDTKASQFETDLVAIDSRIAARAETARQIDKVLDSVEANTFTGAIAQIGHVLEWSALIVCLSLLTSLVALTLSIWTLRARRSKSHTSTPA